MNIPPAMAPRFAGKDRPTNPDLADFRPGQKVLVTEFGLHGENTFTVNPKERTIASIEGHGGELYLPDRFVPVEGKDFVDRVTFTEGKPVLLGSIVVEDKFREYDEPIIVHYSKRDEEGMPLNKPESEAAFFDDNNNIPLRIEMYHHDE